MTPNQNGSRETWNGAEWLRIENVDFKQIAKRAYFYDKEHFVNKFTNYAGCDNDTLNNHFELIRNKQAFDDWVNFTAYLESVESVDKAPYGYGIKPATWEDYHNKAKTNSTNPEDFMKWVWNGRDGHCGVYCDKINDNTVAILYARGNFCIPGVINNKKLSYEMLNNKTPQKAFNTILKSIANFVLFTKGFGYLERNSGWAKVLYYASYENLHQKYYSYQTPTRDALILRINNLEV